MSDQELLDEWVLSQEVTTVGAITCIAALELRDGDEVVGIYQLEPGESHQSGKTRAMKRAMDRLREIDKDFAEKHLVWF